MAYQVIIRKRFQNKVIKLLAQLEEEWGKKVADDFAINLNHHLKLLSGSPFIGLKSEKID
eukprot:gene1092-1428_t